MDERGRPFVGLACPRCSSSNSITIDSRNCDDKQARRRRHQCSECDHRYTTYEIMATDYERLLAVDKGQSQVDAAITALQAVKGTLGANNGTTRD